MSKVANNPEHFLTMSKEERLKLVYELVVYHPTFNTAMHLIERAHRQYGRRLHPQCALIYGYSGTGKTTVLELYEKKHQRFEQKEKTGPTGNKQLVNCQRIISCEISASMKRERFIEEMLYKLGDNAPTQGTAGDKEYRMFRYIRDCEVELILLDEIQHFVKEKQKGYVLEDLGDWFKTIINKSKVPIVLFGTEVATQILTNPQLDQRCKPVYELQLSEAGLDNIGYFHEILKRLDAMLPFYEDSILSDCPTARHLHYCSNGVMRILMDIVRDAAELAIERDAPCIEAQDLSEAWSWYQADKDDPFAD